MTRLRTRLRWAMSLTGSRASRHTSGLRKLRPDVITSPLRLRATGSGRDDPPVPNTLTRAARRDLPPAWSLPRAASHTDGRLADDPTEHPLGFVTGRHRHDRPPNSLDVCGG